jgi:hypothetical protein
MEPCSILMTTIVILMEPLLPWGEALPACPSATLGVALSCRKALWIVGCFFTWPEEVIKPVASILLSWFKRSCHYSRFRFLRIP